MFLIRLLIVMIGLVLTISAAQAQSRGVLRMVGSSTIYPFSTATAENFGAKGAYPTPVVESTGTGGGMNLFCNGLGPHYPDITGASRRMRPSEFELCQSNGVRSITEIMIGFDGIVIGNSTQARKAEFEKSEIFLALAAEIPMPVDASGTALFTRDGQRIGEARFADVAGYDCSTLIDNPHRHWSDINPVLPTDRIEVFGPPPTSGTRDAFVELGLHPGARQIACLDQMYADDRARFDTIASRVREDGAWVDSGENDNTVVQTLTTTPGAFGVFGYSFLEQNADRIQGAVIDGVDPDYDAIAAGRYPISRSLYFYIKNQHEGVIPGLRAFVLELTSEDAWGPFGYMSDRGLIALPEARRESEAEQARELTPMEAPE